MRHVAPLSPVPSLDCAYFPSPRGYTLPTFRLSDLPTFKTRLHVPCKPSSFMPRKTKRRGPHGGKGTGCVLQNKTPRSGNSGAAEKCRGEKRALLLWRFRGRRLRRGFLRGGPGRSRGRRGAALYRVRLVVQAHDVLRDVDIGGGKKNWRVLRGRIQDGHVAILTRIAVEHIDHFAPDAVEHVGLRGVYIFLVFVLLALYLPRLDFALALQTREFLRAEFAGAGIDALPQIVNLLVQSFQLALAGRKLRLQFGAGLLAFSGAGNGLAHIDDADFSRRRGTRRGALRAQRACAESASSGDHCELNCLS